jgi:hypothetical protein
MGKLKNYVIKADEFAQEHYNEPREEFVMMTKFYFDDRLLQQRAVQQFDEIRSELNAYFQGVL